MPPLPRWLVCLSPFGGALVSLVGLLVLLGWTTGIATLTSILPAAPQMSPLTALTFVVAGFALLLTVTHDRRVDTFANVNSSAAWVRRGARCCALGVALVGSLRLLLYITDASVAPDALGFGPLGNQPVRMSPASALCFLLTGIALLGTPRPAPPALSPGLAVCIGLLGWLGVAHYLYGGEPLLPFARMAVHTAAQFLVLSISLLAARLDSTPMVLLTSDTLGGSVARRLIPAALLAPVLLGWCRLQGERLGWYGTEAGISLFGLSNMLLFGVLVWLSAQRLHRSDIQRRQAHAEADKHQRLLQAIADHSPAVIYVKDLSGRYLFVNRRFEEIFDLLRETILGRTDHNLFGKEIADVFRRMDLEAAQAQQPVIAEEIAPHRDGVLHTYLSVKCRLRDPSGRVSATMGVSTDISDRKTAESALRQSEARFRTLAESLPQLVWTCRADGWCDFLSRRWVEYTGEAESLQLGHSWTEHVHPEDRATVQAQWTQAVQGGDTFDTEFRLRRADGAFRWFRARAIALRNDEGKITQWFGSNTDVEDYKHSEARLRTQIAHLNLLDRTTRAIADRQDLGSISHAVLRSIEDHLPADFGCICLYEPIHQVLTVFRVGGRSLALAAELAMSEQSVIEINGNGLARCVGGELVYEPDVAAVDFPFPQRLARVGLRAFVAAPLLVEGQVFGVMVIARRKAASFESPDCEFLRQLSLHVGLAAHQAHLYAALQHAYDDLRQTQKTILQQERLRVVVQMASGVAHDINNALSPAALYAQSLLETSEGLSERSRASLKIIERAIDDVSQTVTRLRDFYRPQEEVQAAVSIDVNRTLEHVLELTRARWQDMPQERGTVIRPQFVCDPELPAIIGSESELRDALTNLVLNAIDAMPKGGTLTLRSAVHRTPQGAAAGSAILIEVCDTGIGMDEMTRNRCLEPFFTTKGERGTGLGLAMVYGMVQRHGGDITFDSTPGVGTSVRLAFPAAPSKSSAAGTAIPPRLVGALKLLLVDDDPLLLETLVNILEEDGHEVIAADGGQAGIDAFGETLRRREPVDVVITDLGMPHIDGRQVAASIKGSSPSTPVILLTGWGHRLLSDNDIPENVDRVLGKPPKLKELRAALAEVTAANSPSIASLQRR
jgi:PAS domain S-box-containing protein